MGEARLLPYRRAVQVGTAFAFLSTLCSVAVVDAARAVDDPTVPAVSTTTAAPTAAPSTSSTTTPPTTPPPTTKPPTTKPPTTPPPAASTPTLRAGSRGPAVLRLHRRLTKLGYDVGSVNSTFSEDTLHAVRAFQKVQRLPVNGVVTARTWARLAAPAVPRPRFPRAASAIEVDLTKRVLYLTERGTVATVFDISPGKSSTPTVRGRFRIYRRVNRWEHGTLGGLYRPNYFHNGFALHGSLSVPTYAASHGCVRLTTASMDRLWPRLSRGKTVFVYRR